MRINITYKVPVWFNKEDQNDKNENQLLKIAEKNNISISRKKNNNSVWYYIPVWQKRKLRRLLINEGWLIFNV